MAIKGPFAFGRLWPLDMGADLGHDRRSESHVGDEVTIHLEHRSQLLWSEWLAEPHGGRQTCNIDMKPCSSSIDSLRARSAQGTKIGGEY